MTKYNILNQVKVLKEVQHIIKYQGFNNVILKISSGFLVDLSVSSLQFSSVAQSCLTLRPDGVQLPRLPCPSSISGICSNSCPLSQ